MGVPTTNMTLREEIAEILAVHEGWGGLEEYKQDSRVTMKPIDKATDQILSAFKKSLPKKKEFEMVDWGGGINVEEVKDQNDWSNHMGKGFNQAIEQIQETIK